MRDLPVAAHAALRANARALVVDRYDAKTLYPARVQFAEAFLDSSDARCCLDARPNIRALLPPPTRPPAPFARAACAAAAAAPPLATATASAATYASAVVDARINRCLAHVHRSRRRRDNISGPLFVDGTAAVRPPSGRSAYAYAGEFDP